MSSTSPDPRPTQQSRGPRGASVFWLLPALTFVIGLLIGGIVVGLTGFGVDSAVGEQEPGDAAAGEPEEPEAPATPEPGSSPDRTITVPGECLQVAERSQEALTLTQEAAQALGELDARRLQGIVDRLQDLEPQVRELAAACQEAGGNVDGGATPSPTTQG